MDRLRWLAGGDPPAVLKRTVCKLMSGVRQQCDMCGKGCGATWDDLQCDRNDKEAVAKLVAAVDGLKEHTSECEGVTLSEIEEGGWGQNGRWVLLALLAHQGRSWMKAMEATAPTEI